MHFPSFYRMVPNEAHQYRGIVHLLRYFQWTWVAVIASDDDREKFVQTMKIMLSEHGLCTAFSKTIPVLSQIMKIAQFLDNLSVENCFVAKIMSVINYDVNVYVVNSHVQTTTGLKWIIYFYSMLQEVTEISLGKVWIMTAQWDFSTVAVERHFDIQVFHGALSFSIHSNEVPGFSEFLRFLHPDSHKEYDFLKLFWEQAFDCLFPDSVYSTESSSTCTGQKRLENLPGTLFEMSMTGQSYSIYNAVHAVAHALQKAYSSRPKCRTSRDHCKMFPQTIQSSQVRTPYIN